MCEELQELTRVKIYRRLAQMYPLGSLVSGDGNSFMTDLLRYKLKGRESESVASLLLYSTPCRIHTKINCALVPL